MAAKPRFNRFQSLGPHGFHEIAYVEWGDPRSEHLVFCMHGFTRNSRDFDVLAESLADRCHVVCMDAAGRGTSEWLRYKGDYSFSLYQADAAALLARMTAAAAPPTGLGAFFKKRNGNGHGKRRIDWIGTSMGGLVGMMLASKHKSPIRRLVLNDVGPLVPWPALVRLKHVHSGLHKKFADYGEVELHLREVCATFGPLDDVRWKDVVRNGVFLQEDGTFALSFDPAVISHIRSSSIAGIEFGSEFLFGVNLWPTYEAVRCPTLVLRGANSDLLLRKTAEEMSRRGPKADIIEFAGVGHAPWLMTQDQIRPIHEFLFEESPARDLRAQAKAPELLTT